MSAHASGPQHHNPPSGALPSGTKAPSEHSESAAPYWLDALDHAGLAMWEAHLPSRAVRFTPAFLDLLGYVPEALEPRLEQWRALLHPQDVLRIDALLTRLSTGQIAQVRCECRLRHVGGDYRNLLLLVRAGLSGDEGRPQRLIGTLVDLSERHGLESALAGSEARFKAVFDLSPAGLALMDLTGRWLDVNPALCELLGHSAEQLRELSFQELTSDEDLQTELELAQSVLDGRQDSYRLDKRLRRQDGGEVAVTLLNRLIRDSAGAPGFFLSQVVALPGCEGPRDDDRQASAPVALAAVADPEPAEADPAATTPRPAPEPSVVHPFRARAGFVETLDAEVHLARRGNQHLALILVGLDGLAELSLKHGQVAVDAVLAEISQRLRGSIRRSDMISRFGSDAFAVLLKQLDSPEQALRVVESLVFEAQRAVAWRGHAVRVNASLGASLYPQDGDDPEALLQAATRARYLARETGGNGFRFADGGFDAVMSDRSALFAVLRRALDEGAVCNSYQAVLGAEDDLPRMLRVQPVIRNGNAAPVPVADLLGEAAPGDLLEQVQTISARQAAVDSPTLFERFGQKVPLAFTLGRLQLRQTNLDRSLTPLDELRHDIDSPVIAVLDERDVARMDERVFSRLVELRRRGLDIAIGGFGVGISHFPRLSQLAPGWVFLAEGLAEQHGDPIDARVLRALIRMARCMDAQVAWPAGVALPPLNHSRLDIDAAVVTGTWLPESSETG